MKIQEIKSNQQSKYEEIIKYLKQNNGYWLENDKWDLTKEFFVGKKIYDSRYIDFSFFKNEFMKNEAKFYILFSFKEKYISKTHMLDVSYRLMPMANFLGKYYKNINTFSKLGDRSIVLIKWKSYLFETNINTELSLKLCNSIMVSILDFIKDFYDDREETEKDIWYSKNIKGAKKSATSDRTATSISFVDIPLYYRETVKKYFRTIITKRSWVHCFQVLNKLKFFFNYFYSNDYKDGFIENLNRNDIEKYLFHVGDERKGKNLTEKSKYISYIRTFLEYIQMAQYDKVPKKEVSLLIFQDDIPKREFIQDEMRKVKFIPEPILKQLDNNIMNLDRPQFIPIYILLRETGWRGTDILNLRYHNCLEQIWNNKEQQYNYYLCGEITKTGIAQLKIPIRDKVAEMLRKVINKAKVLSTEENNPKKYLFNTYEGKLKGRPLNKQSLLYTIQRLIKKKDIRDANGELYHFRLHSLRHTRAKEYVEQGMGISIIQQILGHRSLQMTVHYATVTENTLYEKWKDTEDLELFKVDTKTNELEKVDLNSDTGENLIRYEYVKKNLDAVRVLWTEKNKIYLKLLEDTLIRVKEQKIIHKNGKSREEA